MAAKLRLSPFIPNSLRWAMVEHSAKSRSPLGCSDGSRRMRSSE